MRVLAELLDADDAVCARVYGRLCDDDPYVRVTVVDGDEELALLDLAPLSVTVLREALAQADELGRESST